ncbi:hypothetical protein ROZALSC1DRAFT_26330, partial [Rozella allomycis CSF55]
MEDKPAFETRLSYNGIMFLLNRTAFLKKSNQWTAYYRCQRSKDGCSAKLIFSSDSTVLKGDHTCQIKNDKMNIIDAIQHPPYSICPEGRQIFRRYWSGDVKGELHKILLWASDEMLGLLRLNSHTFIDGTFRSSPLPFKQLV